MPDCSYCGASFDDEEALLAHMGAEHEGELGTIDRRRVADREDGDDGGLPLGPLVLGGVVVLALAVVIYVTLFLGGGDGGTQGPGPVGSAHEHGTIEMRVLGETVDFSRPEYQRAREVNRFHFEGGNGDVWHTHATGVTLQWAMDTLDIGVTDDTVTYEGTTYRDGDPAYDVVVEVNGESVDPSSYVLEGAAANRADEGDDVRIVVRRTNGTAGSNGTAG